MDIETYDKFVDQLVGPGARKYPVIYAGLKLAGEAGEVADELGKAFRDDDGQITEDRLQKIKLELGDTLWYVFRLAKVLGLTVPEIMEANIKKLEERHGRKLT